ncbi:hypothetical protein ABWH96_10020 [Marivirga tractuosa]|uniref:hypothetical protein n=1 Tax=Marivirga tractuosa TaxID=1006 RepID=UPI0035CFCC8C
MDNHKPISTKILILYIILIVVGGIASFFLIEDWIVDNVISNGNLKDLTHVYGLLGFVVSVITILLLYHNYRQSQIEFNKISESNNKAIEIQLILYEKQKIDNEISKIDTIHIDELRNILTEIINKRNLKLNEKAKHWLKLFERFG